MTFKSLYSIAFIAFVLMGEDLAFGSADSEGRSWFGLFGTAKSPETYSLWHELQLRYNPSASEMQQMLARFGWIYKIDDSQEWGMLFAYVITGKTHESRPTLQYLKNMSFYGF